MATVPGATFDGVFWGGNSVNQVSIYRVVVACVAELFGTLVLIWTVIAISESNKNSSYRYWGPVMIGFAVLAIGNSLGGPSGFAINPARDLAPRILGGMLGTQGLFDGYYWFVAPVLIPLMAGPLGVVLYDKIISLKNSDT